MSRDESVGVPKRKSVFDPTKSNDGSYLAKLEKLRNFIPNQVSEADLSACLRQCGCNIQLAAERLMTGQFQRNSSHRSGGKTSFFRIVSESSAGSSSAIGKREPLSQSSSDRIISSPAASSSRRNSSTKRPRTTPNTSRQSTGSMDQIPASSIRKAAAEVASGRKTPVKSPQASSLGGYHRPSQPSQHLLLCQRWIVGRSTTNYGKTVHKEDLSLAPTQSGPPMVRFKGSQVEGTLPTNLCEILAPLLRHLDHQLIALRSESLMGESGIPIGGEVPLSLSVYIAEPREFFGVFEDSRTGAGGGSSLSAQFLASRKQSGVGGSLPPKRKRNKLLTMPLAEAAFALLQWAEYGDVPEFISATLAATASPASAKDDVDSNHPDTTDETSSSLSAQKCSKDEDAEDDDDAEETLMTEDQFEAEDRCSIEQNSGEDAPRRPDWAADCVQDASKTALPEIQDPKGLKDGIVLRSYQRQAVAWMLKRETEKNTDRKELESELKLLAELNNSSKSPTTQTNLYGTSCNRREREISCDCGPVHVNPDGAQKSMTIDGVLNPLDHPLWQRRYLATNDMKSSICFFVNELVRIAISGAPQPPKQCIGGMLCDAMGLGKTVMILSLIMKDKEESSPQTSDGVDDDVQIVVPKKRKLDYPTTLVVAPLSLIAQWEEEIASKSNLTHQVYYAETAKGFVGPGAFTGKDVIITTYGTIQSELHSMKKQQTTEAHGLLSYEWHRVVLDEAHCCKNPATLVSKACCMLKGERRWCVTGTPISNSLQDVFALLKFLRHEPWCESGFWKAAITSAMHQAEDLSDSPAGDTTAAGNSNPTGMRIALDRVRRLLAPLILRRTKDSLDTDGKPILTLPPVETKVVSVELSPSEREFYNSLLAMSQSVFVGFLEAGVATKSWFQIFSLLSRLRQACDHVALTVKTHVDVVDWNQADDRNTGKSKAEESSTVVKSDKKPLNAVDGFDESFLEGLLVKFKIQQSKTDPKDRGLAYATSVAESLLQSIKRGAESVEDECPICLEKTKIRDVAITPCAHMFCRKCLIDVLREKSTVSSVTTLERTLQCPDGECPTCNEVVRASKIVVLEPDDAGRIEARFLTVSKSKGQPQFGTIDKKSHRGRAQTCIAARQTLQNAVSGAGSAKLSAILDELDLIWEMEPGSKVLIFSQYLGFLELIGGALGKRGVEHDRLDGQLSFRERVAVLERFKNRSKLSSPRKKSGSVLLLSMKAGGLGINLQTAASTVFVVDPWWNAAVEEQCLNRVHRIGQTAKVVRVRKFVVRDSVEERMVRLQSKKKGMATEVLKDSNQINDLSENNSSRPTIDDLKLLFGS